MRSHLGVRAAAGARDHIEVHVVGREGLRVVLHKGTAPEIAEDEPTTGDSSAPAGRVPRRLLIAVGPTAGHVYPALAIADAYRGCYPASEVRFAGSVDPRAARWLAAGGYSLETVSASELVNVGPVGKLAGAGRALAGFVQARGLLRGRPPRLAIGLGGYGSGAVLLAARSLVARVVIHEANAVPGLANRLLTPFAHRIHVGSPAAAAAFHRRGVVITHRAALGAGGGSARAC
jgi:UDP-N-acetylglucosamine:LPS N-acetylglucosamine transferase